MVFTDIVPGRLGKAQVKPGQDDRTLRCCRNGYQKLSGRWGRAGRTGRDQNALRGIIAPALAQGLKHSDPALG